MAKKTEINLEQLEQEIDVMSVRCNLYKTLKRSLEKRGWWKEKPRGKPNYNIGISVIKK